MVYVYLNNDSLITMDANDLRRHLDYIHYNPVKHGLAASPKEWPYSSFTPSAVFSLPRLTSV
jgi:hypothetical protein